MKNTKKAAIYARCASPCDSKDVIENQVSACKEFAKSKELDVIKIFSDVGSGMVMRPDLQKLLGEAANGGFQYVIANSVDRLSRSVTDITNYQSRLKSYGIKVLSVTEQFDDISIDIISRLYTLTNKKKSRREKT
jgi:DNA invertase Pin-like site-specific DNA recombinase